MKEINCGPEITSAEKKTHQMKRFSILVRYLGLSQNHSKLDSVCQNHLLDASDKDQN